MSKSTLPKDFLWGFATASYQIEGAAHVDGRADSIWDTFCRTPGKIGDGSDGEVACDSYHRYVEDVALLKSIGAKAYRFSISWSRVIPLGGRDDPVNEKGLSYYRGLVSELVQNGIVPVVTLFHWDLPQSLHDRYGGPLNQTEFVKDYKRFASVIFEALGSQVQHWVTFNEPWCTAILGYNTGFFAPGRTSDRSRSEEGDGSVEPWRVGHSLLIAHAEVVKLYREHYKPRQHGQIGIILNGDWAEAWDPDNEDDAQAAQRKLEFWIGWFADPIYKGDYPDSMRKQLEERLPRFTDEERALVLGSNDFYGMNHYTADYVRHQSQEPSADDHFGSTESFKTNKSGKEIGLESGCTWLRSCPSGFRHLLNWISTRYDRPPIYITENGTSIKDENKLSAEDAVNDDFRVQYYQDYIAAMAAASTEDWVDVRGYFAWSLLDNFEWADGYQTRFGVVHVDYENQQIRRIKKSAHVVSSLFAKLLQTDEA